MSINENQPSDAAAANAEPKTPERTSSVQTSRIDSSDLFNDLAIIEPAIGTLRRQRLRVALKLMLVAGAFGVLFVFVSAFFSDSTDERVFETMRVPLSQQSPGTAEFYNWNGRPVVVVHRTPEQMAALVDVSGLRDPDSRRSKQPELSLIHI